MGVDDYVYSLVVQLCKNRLAVGVMMLVSGIVTDGTARGKIKGRCVNAKREIEREMDGTAFLADGRIEDTSCDIPCRVI